MRNRPTVPAYAEIKMSGFLAIYLFLISYSNRLVGVLRHLDSAQELHCGVCLILLLLPEQLLEMCARGLLAVDSDVDMRSKEPIECSVKIVLCLGGVDVGESILCDEAERRDDGPWAADDDGVALRVRRHVCCGCEAWNIDLYDGTTSRVLYCSRDTALRIRLVYVPSIFILRLRIPRRPQLQSDLHIDAEAVQLRHLLAVYSCSVGCYLFLKERLVSVHPPASRSCDLSGLSTASEVT